MTFLADKLNHRVEIKQPIQTPNADGGYDRSYETLFTIWGGVEPIKYNPYIRGTNSEQGTATHKFTFRFTALSSLGRAFGLGFGDGFDTIADLNTLKSEYYLFMKKNGAKGKLFRVKNIKSNAERDEYILVMAEEIEEHGTGFDV